MDAVERQLAAYNARDVDAFMACFAKDVRVERGSGELITHGWDAMYERYRAAFAAEPNVHCEILHRIRHFDYVVDHEHLTGYLDGSVKHAVAIYHLTGDLIDHVRFL